jgi:phage terminase large subunit-like protein
VRQACERHLRDIEQQSDTGLRWDADMSQWVMSFFELNLTVEKENEVFPFVLEPFERFIVGSIFGWFNPGGTRRFRTAYVEVPKGNGKSPLAAGIGIYGLVGDGQISPEIYSAATQTDQARISWKDARVMVERSPGLSGVVDVGANCLTFAERGGIFRPVSSEHKGLDGKRVHMAIIDELHEHPSSMVVDKMRAGTKARRNALIFEITNSGSDPETVCGHHHDYSLQVLNGTIDDPGWFAYVCSLDEGDSWTDESCWPKVNPGLGTILPIEYLREQVREAIGMPSKQNIVKRLNFCIWTQQHELWIDIDRWDKCEVPGGQDELAGRDCWAGLDLSSKLDLTSLVLSFRTEDGIPEQEVTVGKDERGQDKKLSLTYSVDLLPFFWIPEDTMHLRAKEDMVPYPQWAAEDLIEPTPGNVVDYSYILERIVSLSKIYNFQEIGYDPHNATDLVLRLQGMGFKMVEVRQGWKTLSEPAKMFEALIMARRLRHYGHRVMRWCVGNVSKRDDRNENYIVEKYQKRRRIDGVIASIIGLSRLIVANPGTSVSCYDRGERAMVI